MISWIEQGQLLEKTETRSKARKVLVACSMFDPEVFNMKDRVLMFTRQLIGTGKEKCGGFVSRSLC